MESIFQTREEKISVLIGMGLQSIKHANGVQGYGFMLKCLNQFQVKYLVEGIATLAVIRWR